MKAGLLEEIIEIQEPVTVKTDTGTEETTYGTTYRVRSKVSSQGGDRVNENGDIFYSHHVIFEIRRFYSFDERYRIVWKGNSYRILCIERNRHDQSIKIICDLINE